MTGSDRGSEPAAVIGGAGEPRVTSGRPPGPSPVTVIGLSLSAVFLVIVTIGNEQRVQDWDPQFTRVIVDRAAAYGGTFYENGVFNKGPLELIVHGVASTVAGPAGYWLFISGVVAAISLGLALVARQTARFAGASGAVAGTVGVVTLIHFAISDSDYAGVLYSRNLTAMLLAVVWILLITAGPWSSPARRLATSAAIGALLGLAVQTLLTTVFSALAFAVAAVVIMRDQAPAAERLRLVAASGLAGSAAFLSAPAWYAARGAFDEFWAGWITHARFMSIGTGRSLASQFGIGWDRFYAYHQTRPLMVAIVAGFLVVTWRNWRSWDLTRRVLFTTAAVWWAAAWIEMILSQRYSSHYFSIIAVPVAVMAALLVGLGVKALAPDRPHLAGAVWWPAAAVVAAIYLMGPANATDAWTRTGSFQGTSGLIAAREKSEPGHTRTTRAVLDLVSEAGDPLLAWTNESWPYLATERVSATRFPWSSFLVGDIYLGRSGPEFVLPQTWDWFFDDVDESRPVALAEVRSRIDDEIPFAAYAAAEFTHVHSGSLTRLSLRHEIADNLLSARGGEPWAQPIPPATGSGWTVGDDPSAMFDREAQRVDNTALVLTGMCRRVDGTVSWPDDEQTGLIFYFVDTTGMTERLHIGLERTQAFSGSDVVRYEAAELPPADAAERSFGLVVGGRSAALVVDGIIVAALRLPPSMEVRVEPRASWVALDDLRTGPAPLGSGC
jgi:hypothetical protein